ncbi:MAG: GNAT family N-acetyltransferase [Clostridia bacterium]|nr:GNAT family N-acetyltransferase [Clostridia bacterium]
MDIKGIDNLGLDRVLKRGSGEIIEEQEDALLIRDRVSGAYMLACEDTEVGLQLLDRHIGKDCDMLFVSNYALGLEAFRRYGFSGKNECYQVAYYGEKPTPDPRLSVRTADERDLPVLVENYHLVGPEELKKDVKRGAVWLGYSQNQLVGFIGEHAEGSMGMLFIFPEYRQMGFGGALESHLIARTMERGFVPFAQVVKENRASLELQRKLGMSISENLVVWMWR